MSRPVRFVVFALAAAGLCCLLLLGLKAMPGFGGAYHPYRDAAVPAAVSHGTANVVSSVNFDLRGFDTLGEETILLASVIGASVLLRPAKDETRQSSLATGRTLDASRLVGYVMLPATVVLGLDVIAHGHLTPGGGFQGGVVIATGVHLLYVAGSYPALQRLRPLQVFELGEALGSASFACLGVAGALAAAGFLVNLLPPGQFGTLFSSGTVELLNGAVGIEVASGAIVLLSGFLEQVMRLRDGDAEGAS